MNAEHPILIVDDEQNIRRILQVAFEKAGLKAETAESAEQALVMLAQNTYCCLLTDVTMPGMSGFELHEEVVKSWPELPVIIMTAYGTIPQAVKAIRLGAFEFITKPFDLDSLKKIVFASISDDKAAPTAKRAKRKEKRTGPTFIAESPKMCEVLETIQQVADARCTVLVTGESGTGKEVVARMIHDLSPRSEMPFVAASCAAIPESLLESELFGYEKGAFTGANNAKPGRFELAHEGTLFLDEIGDVPPLIQVKLLRVLQEREFERLGATKPTRVDVRIITATHRNIQQLVDEGLFRLDLMFRLKVVEICLPPLRERPEDIAPLAKHYLNKFSEENGRNLTTITPSALALLESYSWPGNVRELSNLMERAVVLAPRESDCLDLPQLPSAIRNVA